MRFFNLSLVLGLCLEKSLRYSPTSLCEKPVTWRIWAWESF